MSLESCCHRALIFYTARYGWLLAVYMCSFSLEREYQISTSHSTPTPTPRGGVLAKRSPINITMSTLFFGFNLFSHFHKKTGLRAKCMQTYFLANPCLKKRERKKFNSMLINDVHLFINNQKNVSNVNNLGVGRRVNPTYCWAYVPDPPIFPHVTIWCIENMRCFPFPTY